MSCDFGNQDEIIALLSEVLFPHAEDCISILSEVYHRFPAFSTLDRMAGRIHRLMNRGIYQTVFARISEAEQQALSRLLFQDGVSPFTAFDRIEAMQEN